MILAIHKPVGMTSHDVIDRLRRITGERRIGHAGTLDPLAEGVLVVAIGRESTRQLASIVATEKEYVATIRLGATSTTDDDEGDKSTVAVSTPPDRPTVERALQFFVGVIQQVPPAYSAVKVRGQRAYRAARQGRIVALEPRTVKVTAAEVLAYDWPTIRARFTTGKGVYVRSLARDLGERLGTGAYLTGLVRTRVGEFTLDRTRTLDAFLAEYSIHPVE